jgi:three-Cys-motif partner protein
MPLDKPRKTDQSNRFGSLHTQIKLEALEKYLRAYTKALKNLPFTLHYLDAFAGTGTCEIKVGDKRLTIPGSSAIAIECTPPFHKLVFIEKSSRKVKALQRLKDADSTRDVTVIHDDANKALPACLAKLNFCGDRAIVFLDPFGMQVEWQTLRQIASTKFTDLLYLFPLSGLYRQATRSAAKIHPVKEAALRRIFGTMEWRTAFYEAPPQQDFFEQASDVRTKSVTGMLDWVKQRLGTIFPAVADPMVLYQVRKDGKRGPPNFALFFAISNPSQKAIELALRLANAVLKQK